MWVEILCGLVAYKIIRRVFFADDGDPSYLADLDSSHSDLCFAVASRSVPISSVPSFPLRPAPACAPLFSSEILETVLLTRRFRFQFQVREALCRPVLRRPPHPRPRRWRAPTHRRRPRHQEVSPPSGLQPRCIFALCLCPGGLLPKMFCFRG
jgi:hypothetical protein